MSDVSTWSAIANANNSPSPNGFPENMPPSGVNDSCREVMAAVKRADLENAKLAGANAFTGSNTFSAAQTFNHLVTLEAGADIASAATIDLTAATGNCPRITGTTATSSVTMNTGQWALVVADGAWPLTYHATTNKLNTGESYTCVAGDVVLYHKDLSGIVHGTIFPVEPLVDYSASSTIVGWSSFTTKEIYTRKRGKQLFVHYKIEGTSNSVNTTFTLPYTTDARQYSASSFVVDNGTGQSGPGYVFIAASGATVTIYKDFASNAFTASGTKQVRGQFFVNIA